MPTYEVSYTKDGKQDTFTVEQSYFSDDEAWGAIVERLRILLLDQNRGESRNDNQSLAEAAGVSDVHWKEV